MLGKAKELQEVIKEKYGLDAQVSVSIFAHDGLPQDEKSAEFFANAILQDNAITPSRKEGNNGGQWIEGVADRIRVTFFLPDK